MQSEDPTSDRRSAAPLAAPPRPPGRRLTAADRRISAAEAAAILGVQKESLYSYISRGMLTSYKGASGRKSWFDPDEVRDLAAKTRKGGRAGSLEVVVSSALTLIQGDHLYFRGRDVADMVPDARFEDVAEWLWETDDPTDPWPRVAPPPETGMTGIARLRTIVAWAGSTDDLRYDLSRAAVAEHGRRAIALMVGGTPNGEGIADRLAQLVGVEDPALVPIVNAVLVLLADHELAASTFAARIAASVRADPYSVIGSGLGPMAGALHGAASAPVVALFQEIARPGRAGVVLGERLARHEHLPGIGHKVYRAHDPRAQILLKMLRETGHPRMQVVNEVVEVLGNRHPMVVNVDFALGALAWVGGLDREATQVMFSVARTAGWLAHALEEYGEDPLRFRYRVAYSGFSPQNEARGLRL